MRGEGSASKPSACYNDAVFAKLYVEITDVCNLRCPFCPPTLRPKRFMTGAEFDAILGKLEGQGRLLYLHVKGEPLLHPELGEFLEIARKRRFGVALTTNGSLLERQAELLLGSHAIKKLSVSLHSHAIDFADGEGTADADRVGNYWANVASFLDRHRLSPRFPVSLRLWNLRDGALPPETAFIWERMRERYAAVGPWGSPEAWPKDNRLDESVFLNKAEEFTWPDLSLPMDGEAGTCLGLREQIAVLVDGTVVPCCLDGEGRLALGNLFEEDLEAILAAPRAKAMREGFERGVLVEGLCRTCGFRRRFDAG